MNIILKMHIPFTPLCNLHFNIYYVVQFTVKYLMCVYISNREFDAHKIWHSCLISPASGSSANAQLKMDRL